MKSASKVTINTGNVLNLIDIKKKAGQNVTEELSESIKLTLTEWGARHKTPLKDTTVVQNGMPHKEDEPSQSSQSSQQSEYLVMSTSMPQDQVVHITRPHDDIQSKMAEEERKNLKIGVKIFLNEDSSGTLIECLENVFTALHTEVIEHVILAYNPPTVDKHEDSDDPHVANTKASPISIGAKISNTEVEAENESDIRKSEILLPGIKELWTTLENYVKDGRVQQLGVADIGTVCLQKLHSWAKVKPTIAQINLASCCVVPPSLHSFCRANDVQLLTHADPPDLLSQAAARTLSDVGLCCGTLEWCARYQVHIKCRGVLALKGYVCKTTLDSDDEIANESNNLSNLSQTKDGQQQSDVSNLSQATNTVKQPSVASSQAL